MNRGERSIDNTYSAMRRRSDMQSHKRVAMIFVREQCRYSQMISFQRNAAMLQYYSVFGYRIY